MEKKSDDIDIVTAILRWRLRRTTYKFANLKAKIAFWEGRGLVKGGGLPMSVADRLCEWTGRLKELECQQVELQLRLTKRERQ